MYLCLKSRFVFEKLKSTRFDCCWHIWVRTITKCQTPPLPLTLWKTIKEKKKILWKYVHIFCCFYLLFYRILCHLRQGDKLCRFGSLLVSQGWGIRRWNQHVCVPGWHIKAHRESVCVYVCIRRACMYVGRYPRAHALWDFDNPNWITFMTHASHFNSNSPFFAPSFLCTCSLFPFTLHLSLSSFLPASLLCSETKGVGGQSHSPFQGSKSLFFLRFSHSCSVLHVAALLSCSNLSLPPSLPPFPHSKWMVGHRTSFWFLSANEPASTWPAHTRYLTRSMLCACTTPHSLCRFLFIYFLLLILTHLYFTYCTILFVHRYTPTYMLLIFFTSD